jgi:RNA-directed DNA polymerase
MSENRKGAVISPLLANIYLALRRQRTKWNRMVGIADRWLPPARVVHPWPERRFATKYPRWEPGARIAPAGI